ncbi:hypothetical protein JCM9743_02870 [Natrinema sp. JCM 9743]
MNTSPDSGANAAERPSITVQPNPFVSTASALGTPSGSPFPVDDAGDRFD